MPVAHPIDGPAVWSFWPDGLDLLLSQSVWSASPASTIQLSSGDRFWDSRRTPKRVGAAFSLAFPVSGPLSGLLPGPGSGRVSRAGVVAAAKAASALA